MPPILDADLPAGGTAPAARNLSRPDSRCRGRADVIWTRHRRSSRRAATYVDRLLRGAKVSELPVQFPTKYELVVNLKTAKAIGLTIPEAFLLRADEVIE